MSYFSGIGLRATVNEIGFHRARQYINQTSKGNASRIFNDYAEFLPGDSANGIDSSQLYELYRQSVTRQIAV